MWCVKAFKNLYFAFFMFLNICEVFGMKDINHASAMSTPQSSNCYFDSNSFNKIRDFSINHRIIK